MTAIQRQPLNLLFSLPDDLIIEIFGTFDPTYRIFNTPQFRKELCEACNKKSKAIIDWWFNCNYEIVNDDKDSVWLNEYGYMGSTEDITDLIDIVPSFEYTLDNYEIHLHYDYTYFDKTFIYYG